MKPNLKIQAISLRKKGFSHGDIHRKLGISKSTSSEWTNKVPLSSKARRILETKAAAAREKGRNARVKNLKAKYGRIMESVARDLYNIRIDKTLAKLLCAILYWGEGSKTSGQVVFTNSDPQMINAFLKLFRYGFGPEEDRMRAILHLHPYHNEVHQKRYWSKITKLNLNRISVFHKKAYGHIVRENYPGCIAIHYGDMEILHELMYYYKYMDTLLGGFV